MRPAFFLLGMALAACAGRGPRSTSPSLVLTSESTMVLIPAGDAVFGSTLDEREAAYADYNATSGRDIARQNKWFDFEKNRGVRSIPAFSIDLLPVTQAQYAEFVTRTGATPPSIDLATWKSQGFIQDYDSEVKRFNWIDGEPPATRLEHPVVLVTQAAAAAYCVWRGTLVGQKRRLPTADEYEKAARGTGGLSYPWGQAFDAERINSGLGKRDTVAVGSYPTNASPFGVLDLAGNVFQWTSSPIGNDRFVVKGSAWDDYGGVGRGAAWHTRIKTVRHVLVGFRCAGDVSGG